MSAATLVAPGGHAAEMASFRETLASLHEHRLAWERDVTVLFDEFESLAVQLAMDSSATDQQPNQDALEQRWLELSSQNAALAASHSSATDQLTGMRAMIEQQTELLAAFVGAATHMGGPVKPARPRTTADPVTSAVKAEFAQLQRPRNSDNRPGSARPTSTPAN